MKGLRNILGAYLVGCPIFALALAAGLLLLYMLDQLAGFSGEYASSYFPSGQDWMNIVVFIVAVAYSITWIVISLRYDSKLERSGKRWDTRSMKLTELLRFIIISATVLAAIEMAIITGLTLAGRVEYAMSMSP